METAATPVGALSGTPLGLAVLPDGRIVLGGSKTGSSNIELVRFNSNGALDTSFGTGGYLSIACGGTARLHDLAVQSDGRVVGVATLGADLGLVTFRLQGEGITTGKKYAFRSYNSGKYLAAEDENEDGEYVLKANRTAVDSWERFTLKDFYGNLDFDQLRFGDVISLQSHHGKHVVAEPDGDVWADRDAVKSWERWTLVNPYNANDTGPVTCGGIIALRSHHGTYLTGEPQGDVMADRTAIGTWESWTVECH